MRVLHFEDEPIKYRAIRNVLEECRVNDIDWVMTLEEGLEKYKQSLAQGTPYDLIITDMWYPPAPGVHEERSGNTLVEKAVKEKWETPIIVCSNQNYDYPEIYGTLYYSENEDWEGKLRGYISKLK